VFEFVGIMSLVSFVSWSVFGGSALPLTFLVLPVALMATLRFRMMGAIGSVLIVAAISSVATASGIGPIAALLADRGDQVLVLQAFIASIFFCCLPIAVLIAEKDAHADETRVIAEHFRSVVETIGEVIFRLDANGAWVYLNPAWETLSGRQVSTSLGRSWLEQVDPSERREMAERVGAVLRGEERSTRRVLRFDTPAGFRWVELFVQVLMDEEGHVSGAAGTLRDIDDRKRLEEHVMTAKRRAEQRAREATLLASTDELTGIANRRAFMAQLDREIAAAGEFGWPLAVAMFDVDHFKAVNDRYGHAVGDRVLQLIAAQAAGVVRGGDLVGRIGGEEFGILMPGATLKEAAMVAERLRVAMESACTDAALPGVTVSVGIAAREQQATAVELLDVADHALYAAKDDGRNRVRIAA
jgi:diguanylate cyclase (GGDEF)-like protein/PAS domain S-box-containing protein